mgnify:FL=1
MAREVFIHNSRIIKKCLSFTDVIGDENYAVSYLDEYMRFTTQESESCFTMLFNNDSIGRGIQIVETDKNSFHLAVNLPCTEEDVKMLYKLSRRIAYLWKSNHIIVEDTRVELSEIEKVEEQDIAMNKSLHADAPKLFGDDYATLYCVTLPICIPVKQLQGYSDDYQGFSQFLDEKQGLGAFYSCPIFYTLNGEVISLYVGISEGEFILPNKPQMSFMSDGKEVQCDKALIAIPEVFPDEKISKLDYQTFVDRIPKEKVSEFDCQHMLVSTLSLEELQSIYKG